ncbi:MAG TPA: ABC transporter substrate-binding protein [Acidobacteriota bacterium]|nr:ABC transporter substrate-binding protein [Acidobacteriota bacterium]
MNRRKFIKGAGLTLISAAAFPANGILFAGNTAPILKIGYLPITDHLLMIAAEREQFKSVRIRPTRFSSWPEISEALMAGAIDGAFLLTPIGLTLRRNGAPVKAVLLGHRNGSVITVGNRGGINRIEDLKGKTIAIPSPFSTHNLLLRKILTENRIDPAKDLKIIDMAPPEMVNALATGRIHGFIVAEPFGAQAEIQKVGRILTLSKDIWLNHICCVLNLRESVITRYPEAVQELVSAFLRTAAFIESDPIQAARGSTGILGQKPEVIEKVLTSPRDRLSFLDLTPDKTDFSATQEHMIEFGITGNRVDLNSYLDDRFAKKG